MRLDFCVKEPDDVVFEMRMQMTLGEWKQLHRSMDRAREGHALFGPSKAISEKIKDMISKTAATWSGLAEIEEEK